MHTKHHDRHPSLNWSLPKTLTLVICCLANTDTFFRTCKHNSDVSFCLFINHKVECWAAGLSSHSSSGNLIIGINYDLPHSNYWCHQNVILTPITHLQLPLETLGSNKILFVPAKFALTISSQTLISTLVCYIW